MKGMVLLLMTGLIVGLIAGLIAGLSPARSLAAEPDFERLQTVISQMLASSGSGTMAGDRSELQRSAAGGWEIRLVTLWDGESWQLLAARLHHPERTGPDDGSWQERFDELIAGLDRNAVSRRPLPELVDVPPPAFLPAFPGEERGRSFEFEGYWYGARWVNDGGLDLNAEWSLRSYELVALP